MIKQLFAFETIEDLEINKSYINQLNLKLQQYLRKLEEHFELNDFPKAIVWTSNEIATCIFSNVPIPAFTNKDVIYMTPNVKEWSDFYLAQLEEQNNTMVENYYKTITIDHVFCILAHELTHHIDLFVDEFDDERHDSIWFEEGMCEYLSQKLTLSEDKFCVKMNIEREMIRIFKNTYAQHSLDDFGAGSYEAKSLTAIMIDYWRSSQAIKHLVEERYSGDVHKVFKHYNEWHEAGRKIPLSEHFAITDFLKAL
ncbi:hypothetical protein [Rummeliibacillus pycnus]|uniref:hypothetical protein n=1 Tax=Rummeliibacillus pycnus TaxID=101070 RepID=UPI000C9A0ACC|nr:hypothetical protein [Rummeliibacillus pycnus]